MIIYYIQRIRDEKISNIIRESTNTFIDNIKSKAMSNNYLKKTETFTNINDANCEKFHYNTILLSIFSFYIGYTLSRHIK